MKTAVEVSELVKQFGSTRALNELTLSIPEGSVYGIIGPNGAGKSTLVRILTDIVRPTSGTVRVLGRDPRAPGKDLRGSIGYLPGEFRGSGRLNGTAHLKFWSAISGTANADRTYQEGLRFAEMLGVDVNRPVGNLSKGNKQKLGIVQAFMHHPRLLILDEPTSGLDPLVQLTFRHMVTTARDEGATVLLSSHVLSEVEEVADSAAVLRSGRVVAESTIAGLRAAAARTVRAVVTGSSVPDVGRRLTEAGLTLDVTDIPGSAGGTDVLVTGRVDGMVDEFVKALAPINLSDLTISEPDLEQSVLHIYAEDS